MRRDGLRCDARSSRTSRPINSETPAPFGSSITRSLRCLTAGSAFPTATEHSHRSRNGWSFSASPIPTTLWADSFISSSAARSPVSLLTPDGSNLSITGAVQMTYPLAGSKDVEIKVRITVCPQVCEIFSDHLPTSGRCRVGFWIACRVTNLYPMC